MRQALEHDSVATKDVYREVLANSQASALNLGAQA